MIDTIMDHVANALGKDPTEVRKVNISAEGDEVHVGDGRLLGAGALAECFDLCEEKYGERRAEVDQFNAASKERFTDDDRKHFISWTLPFRNWYRFINPQSTQPSAFEVPLCPILPKYHIHM